MRQTIDFSAISQPDTNQALEGFVTKPTTLQQIIENLKVYKRNAV